MLTKINIVTRIEGKGDVATEGYLADQVDKELKALSGTELAKENTRLRLELQEKREDTKAGEDMIVELRAKIKTQDKQFELLKRLYNINDHTVWSVKKIHYYIEKAQRGELK